MAAAVSGTACSFTLSSQCGTLKEIFAASLPDSFRGHVRYAYTSPKSCEPLFSPLPGSEPEQTKLSSHFLTVSIPLAATEVVKKGRSLSGQDQYVLVFAIEVLIYSTRRLTTMFVSKADSTGYLPQRKPSVIKIIATNFLRSLGNRQRVKAPQRPLVISLFARAQSQYLFPGSADNGRKHVLDDRQLIRWWVSVLDPLFLGSHDGGNDLDCRGYITVPGYQGIENVRHFAPKSGEQSNNKKNWIPGNPLGELAKTRGLPEHAPTRCVLPRFPDDPKARFMQDLDEEVGLMEDAGSLATTSPSKKKNGRWKSIHGLDRFWEAMEFRQECSSGRVVGFLWLVVRKESETGNSSSMEEIADGEIKMMADHEMPLSQDGPGSDTQSHLLFGSQDNNLDVNTSSRKSRRKKLTGPIIPRQPRLKGGSSNISATSGSNNSSAKIRDDGVSLGKEGYEKAMQTLLHLDFANAEISAQSTAKWAQEVSSACGVSIEDWVLDIQGTLPSEASASEGVAPGGRPINDLGNMVRKKRKAGGESVDTSSQSHDVPAVNTLNTSLIRKKPKPPAAA